MKPGGGSGWTITRQAAPSNADFAAIFRPLDAETAQVTGPCDIKPLAILIRDALGAVTGGLWARIVYRWLVVEMIYVPPAARGAGLGRALVQEAEAAAASQACIGLQITRLDFQAPGFYEHLGFQIFGVQDDVPPGHRCIYMAKRIAQKEAVLF
jgi:GNAT superfamily N-acetyltransferase